jgi:hypothetical protein
MNTEIFAVQKRVFSTCAIIEQLKLTAARNVMARFEAQSIASLTVYTKCIRYGTSLAQ